jgi:hypothetical protein
MNVLTGCLSWLKMYAIYIQIHTGN